MKNIRSPFLFGIALVVMLVALGIGLTQVFSIQPQPSSGLVVMVIGGLGFILVMVSLRCPRGTNYW